MATCDSGPKAGWKPSETLDDKGQRVEAYFHPVTLEPVPTKPR